MSAEIITIKPGNKNPDSPSGAVDLGLFSKAYEKAQRLGIITRDEVKTMVRSRQGIGGSLQTEIRKLLEAKGYEWGDFLSLAYGRENIEKRPKGRLLQFPNK